MGNSGHKNSEKFGEKWGKLCENGGKLGKKYNKVDYYKIAQRV